MEAMEARTNAGLSRQVFIIRLCPVITVNDALGMPFGKVRAHIKHFYEVKFLLRGFLRFYILMKLLK